MDDEIIIIYDPSAPVAFDVEAVIDLAIINDNISPTGTFIHIEEADEA